MRQDSGEIFLIVKLRLIMYILILPCLQVRVKKLNNLANIESYPSLHYYTVFKGALFAFTKTMEHRVSHGRGSSYIAVTYQSWKVPLRYDGFGLAAFHPLGSVRREKDQLVHHNGGRTLLCRSLSKQLAMAC